MNKIDLRLQEIKKSKKIGLMTHVVIGYPSLATTTKIVLAMDQAGVDFVELQIPFSDPLADGPTIMYACERSLDNGTTVKDAFVVAEKLSNQVTCPLLLMSYYNIVFKYGVERFCKDAKSAGISGLIIPDMNIDEEKQEDFLLNCKKHDIYSIQVVSPASTNDRLIKNSKVSKGFLYCTAQQGTTGAKDELDPNLSLYLKRIRKFFSIPLAVGFGISRKEHINKLKLHADIAVIGSAIINIIDTSEEQEISANVQRFISSLV